MADRQTRWLSPQEQRDWRALILGMTLLVERLDEQLDDTFGLSLTQYEILVRLSESPGRQMRMADLALALRHSRSRVTHTVGRMEEDGWVTRARTPDDGRGVVATMTDAGFELLTSAAPLHVEGVRDFLLDKADPEDFKALGRVMNSVTDALTDRYPHVDIRPGAAHSQG